MFDNQEDPQQLKNLAGASDSAALQARLEAVLSRKLAEAHDEFLPAEEYIRKWGYTVDKEGTVPYEP